ncbi:MAG: HEPN domain-containing protein [Bryobacterales bacterium]|nr:HEPN domain-containing protein [Bryobacterales bacterium]
MDPRDMSYSVVVFPLLKTSQPVCLGPLTFRSTDDLDGLSEDQAASVTEITRMLFALGDQRVKQASYAIADREKVNTPAGLDELGDIEAVVAYLYASPRHEFNDLFLAPEHASITVLTPNRVAAGLVRLSCNVIDVTQPADLEPSATGFVDGYDGVLGLRHHFWVTSGSRVYGTTPHPILNHSQDLASDVEQARRARADYRFLLDLLTEGERGGDIGRRVFTAVRWFNRTNSDHRGESESFICLSVALETLLRVPHGAKKDRFVDSIALLLGRVPRLEDWATQFYDARSRAVHEGTVGHAAFVPKSTPRKQERATTYQSLLAYGREVFQLCLGTVLTGASLASQADLATKLIANSERFEAVCRKLDDDSLPIADRLAQLGPLARAIKRYRHVADSGLTEDMMLGACRRAARITLESAGDIGERLRNALTALAEGSRKDSHFEQLDALRALLDELGGLPDRTVAGVTYPVITLMQVTWHYVFQHYFSIRRRGDADVDTGTSVG